MLINKYKDVSRNIRDDKINIIHKVIEIAKEATDIASLNHPNIINDVDSFRDGALLHTIVKYVLIKLIYIKLK